MTPILISEQELIDFIKSQPDDRKIDMGDNRSNDPCGCLMVQYMWNIGETRKFGCGTKTVELYLSEYTDPDERTIAEFHYDIPFGWTAGVPCQTTYSELKKHLNIS